MEVNCLADTPGSGIASRGDCPLGTSSSLSCLLLLMTRNQSESRSRKYLWTLKMMFSVVRKRCPPGMYNVGGVGGGHKGGFLHR